MSGKQVNKPQSIKDIVVDAYLECRSDNHAWNKIHDRVTGNKGWVSQFVRSKTCQRCGLEKETTYEVPSMRPIKSKSWYPEGYVVHGTGRVPVAEVRMEQLVRAGYKVRGYK